MLLWLSLLGACGSSAPPESVEPELTTFTPVAGVRAPARRDFKLELTQAQALVARQQALVDQRPDAHVAWIALAAAHLNHARLAGGIEDYASAEVAMTAAERLNPDGLATWRQRAALLQSAHHFNDALQLLQRIPSPSASDQASMASMRFQLGEYAPAIETLKTLANNPRDPSTPAQLAACLSRLGQFEAAEKQYEVAASRYHGRQKWPVAWNHLMRGLIDLKRKRYDDALAHYRDADEALPGWWLVEEHIAEIYLLQGDAAKAREIYRRVVATTNSPELTGALADAEQALGEIEHSKTHRKQALRAFEERLKTHPDLVGGHALDFLLEHGDPALALTVARRNAQLRGNGEAKLGLARALENTGDDESAAALREEVVASGWWTGQ